MQGADAVAIATCSKAYVMGVVPEMGYVMPFTLDLKGYVDIQEVSLDVSNAMEVDVPVINTEVVVGVAPLAISVHVIVLVLES